MTPPGLSTQEANVLLSQEGPNSLPLHADKSPLLLLLQQFPSLMNGLLFAAALFSFFFSDLIDAIFILMTILLNGVFSFIQEYKAEKSLQALVSYAPDEVRVIRDQQEKSIPATQLVPGDIVILTEGDRIPADGKLIKATTFEVDESAFTGESLPVNKELDATCLMGTLVNKGNGIILIEKTGIKTRFGQIAKTLSTISVGKTPLEKQLSQLGKFLTFLALAIAALIIPVGLWQGHPQTTVILTAISIAVAAVPEGLPLVLTIALAMGTSRLAHKKAIVRKMQAVETLGAINVLLVDKTGTLTQNNMRVKHIWTKGGKIPTEMLKAALLGNTATVSKKDDGSVDILGDRTDGALLLWAEEQHSSLHSLLKEGKIIDEFVFDVTAKTVSTIWENNDERSIFVRGAPEAIVNRSILSANERVEIEKEYEKFAKEGLRVIAFGYRKGLSSKKAAREEQEKELTFLGFAGLYDPPRKEVSQAIQQAHRAGIKTIMVTGDNELTALTIAKEIGFLETSQDVITGEQLRALSDDQLIQNLKNVQIIARSEPEDKLRIATLLEKQGFIVGVTGDGVNDALVLKKAHVGIAMGESGTDVAKEASDIIITDDNFQTIVRAIEEGRTIYHNLVQAILYLLMSNLSELALVIFATALNLPTILLPTQILWINLVTDGFPALALATDPTSHAVLNDPPRNTKLPLITTKRMWKILGGGIGLALLLSLLYVTFLNFLNPTLARTLIFDGLVLSHLALALIIRGRSLRTISPFFLITLLITLFAQGLVTVLPFTQELFNIGLK
jgi:Ca2+-transporting ATPase